jgi:hypothetical protein
MLSIAPKSWPPIAFDAENFEINNGEPRSNEEMVEQGASMLSAPAPSALLPSVAKSSNVEPTYLGSELDGEILRLEAIMANQPDTASRAGKAIYKPSQKAIKQAPTRLEVVKVAISDCEELKDKEKNHRKSFSTRSEARTKVTVPSKGKPQTAAKETHARSQEPAGKSEEDLRRSNRLRKK